MLLLGATLLRRSRPASTRIKTSPSALMHGLSRSRTLCDRANLDELFAAEDERREALTTASAVAIAIGVTEVCNPIAVGVRG